MNVTMNISYNNPKGIPNFEIGSGNGEFPVRFYKYSAEQVFIVNKFGDKLLVEVSSGYLANKERIKDEDFFIELKDGVYIVDRTRKKVLATLKDNMWTVSLEDFSIEPTADIPKFLFYFEGNNTFALHSGSYYKLQNVWYVLNQARYTSLQTTGNGTSFGKKLVFFMARDSFLLDEDLPGIDLSLNKIEMYGTRTYDLDPGLNKNLASYIEKMKNRYQKFQKEAKKTSFSCITPLGEVALTDLVRRKDFSGITKKYPCKVNINLFPAGNGITEVMIYDNNTIMIEVKEKSPELIEEAAEKFRTLMELGKDIIINAFNLEAEEELFGDAMMY